MGELAAVKGGGIGAVRPEMKEEGGGLKGVMVGEGWGCQQCHGSRALQRTKMGRAVAGVRSSWRKGWSYGYAKAFGGQGWQPERVQRLGSAEEHLGPRIKLEKGFNDDGGGVGF